MVQTLPWALAEFSGFWSQLRWGCKTSQRSPRVGLDPGDPPSSRPSTSPRPLPESPSSGDRCCPCAPHAGRSTGRFSTRLGVMARSLSLCPILRTWTDPVLLRVGLDPRVLQGSSLGSPNGDSPLADGPLLQPAGFSGAFRGCSSVYCAAFLQCHGENRLKKKERREGGQCSLQNIPV